MHKIMTCCQYEFIVFCGSFAKTKTLSNFAFHVFEDASKKKWDVHILIRLDS